MTEDEKGTDEILESILLELRENAEIQRNIEFGIAALVAVSQEDGLDTIKRKSRKDIKEWLSKFFELKKSF